MRVFLIHLSLISPKKGQTSLSFAHFQMTGNREKPSVGTVGRDRPQALTRLPCFRKMMSLNPTVDAEPGFTPLFQCQLKPGDSYSTWANSLY